MGKHTKKAKNLIHKVIHNRPMKSTQERQKDHQARVALFIRDQNKSFAEIAILLNTTKDKARTLVGRAKRLKGIK